MRVAFWEVKSIDPDRGIQMCVPIVSQGAALCVQELTSDSGMENVWKVGSGPRLLLCKELRLILSATSKMFSIKNNF